MSRAALARELRELALLSFGAIPGALLRWQLAGVFGSAAGTAAANLLGCGLIGVLIGLPQTRQRLYLAAGVGFCGSLTTFSSWILEVTRALSRQDWPTVALALSLNLGFGLVALALGYGLGSIRR